MACMGAAATIARAGLPPPIGGGDGGAAPWSQTCSHSYLPVMSDRGRGEGRSGREGHARGAGARESASAHLELKDPRVLSALQSFPAMQRWEILRRARTGLSVAELAERARASATDVQGSLDLLCGAGLATAHPASGRRRHITYTVTRERLLLRWDSSDPRDVAAWRALGQFVRDHSRRVIDEAADRPGAERLISSGCSAAISVSLLEDDAQRIREALRSLYAMLAEADQRARDASEALRRAPYHLAFNLQQLWEPDLPMAEFFVLESKLIGHESQLLGQSARRLLSPREHEVAELLEGGMSRPQIARQLGLSAHTVASISKAIYRKLGITSRAQLTRRLRQA
jgi:DNA-binding NarL/FixJ family response regulator